MADIFSLDIEARTDLGKAATRRLRRLQNKIPAVVYGTGKPSESISLAFNQVVKQLENEAFYSHILTLNDGSNSIKVVLKDMQRHPVNNKPTHLDFLRVDTEHKIHMHVPLHFINEEVCKGVKQQGGMINHHVNEIEVSCLPQDLPEYLQIDLSTLEKGVTLHLSDIQLPANVQILALLQGPEHDLPVVSVHALRGGDKESSTEETAE